MRWHVYFRLTKAQGMFAAGEWIEKSYETWTESEVKGLVLMYFPYAVDINITQF